MIVGDGHLRRQIGPLNVPVLACNKGFSAVAVRGRGLHEAEGVAGVVHLGDAHAPVPCAGIQRFSQLDRRPVRRRDLDGLVCGERRVLGQLNHAAAEKLGAP